MADVITRFKLETTQYDSKLRDSVKGLKEVVKTAELAGKDFKGFEKNTLEAAKALGTIETGANNSKDKVKELVGAFNEMANTYNAMSKAIRESDVGKAMADSLNQLSGRIKEAKKELYDAHSSFSSGGGGLFGGGKLDGMLQVFGGNLMTKGASMLAGFASEIGNCIEQGIELARQGEGIHLAFNRLNQPGLLDNLREATHGTVTDLELMKAAVKFNDFKLPLDQLGTMLAFAQKKAKDTGQSVDYMVDSIVTGLGRKSLMILDNLGLSANEVKEKMKETGDMTKAVGEIIREQMSNAGDYIETAADRASQAHVSLQNKMEELGRKFGPLQEASNQLWTSMKIGILDIVGGPLASLLNGLTKAGQIQNAINDAGGNDRVSRDISKLKGSNYKNAAYRSMLESYSREEQEARNNWLKAQKGGMGSIAVWENRYEAAKALRQDFQSKGREVLHPSSPNTPVPVEVKNLPTGGGGGSTTTQRDMTEMQSNQQRINELTQEYVNISDQSTDAVKARQSEIQKEIALLQARNNTLKLYSEQAQGKFLGGNIQTSELEGSQFRGFAAASLDVGAGLSPKVIEEINNSLTSQISILNQQQKAYGMAAQAAQNFGSAMAGIEDPAAKAAGQVTQAIASIALGFAMASSNANTAGTGWGWLAWLGAGMGAMATTIATIHSLTGFQNGGQVKKYANGGITDGTSGGSIIGTTYSNDQIPIMANAGEVILNKAQQSTLAQNLQGNGGGGMRVVGEIQGEKIVLVANRYFTRTGQGEIVTW